MSPKSTTVKTPPLVYAALVAVLALPAAADAQPDPWAGSWRGTTSTADGQDTGVTLTLVENADAYSGLMTGFAPGREIRLSHVEATDTQLTLMGSADTDFGPLALRYSLTRDERTLSGGGRVTLGDHGFDVTVELTRRRRAEVPQPQVAQRIEYFAGTWTFEYTGGEFPPLSIGTRSGTVTFAAIPHGPFVQAVVTVVVFGAAYTETWTIGFDESAQSVVWHETLSTGQSLIAVGNWTSPIGITFLTAPVEADGRVYVLKRLMRVTSDTAFAVNDEFSIDGGPFQRLGDGAYLRSN